MSKRDPRVPLLHMRDHAQEALLFSAGKKRTDLDTDRQLQLALVHLVQIIGEAASRLPAKERANYPGVPWNQIQGARNRLVHDYDEVDLDILWEIVTKDLHALITQLDDILGRH